MMNLKRLNVEEKMAVAGGEVYKGVNEKGEKIFYVPHPKTRKSHYYYVEKEAKAEAHRLGQSEDVIFCGTFASAKKRSDEKLGEMMRGKSQRKITDFFLSCN